MTDFWKISLRGRFMMSPNHTTLLLVSGKLEALSLCRAVRMFKPSQVTFYGPVIWSFCCDWVTGKSEHSSGLETWRQTEFKSWGVIRNEQDDNIRSTHAESIPVCHNCCRYSNCLEKVILFSFNERKHKVMWNKTKKAKIMATQKNNASRAPQNSPLNCGYFFWHSILFGPCVH